jgi:hypothetical protein
VHFTAAANAIFFLQAVDATSASLIGSELQAVSAPLQWAESVSAAQVGAIEALIAYRIRAQDIFTEAPQRVLPRMYLPCV